MIKQYILPGVFTLLFLGFTFLTVWAMLQGISIGGLEILSFSQISDKNALLDTTKANYTIEETKYQAEKILQETAKNEYNAAKQEYDNLSDDVISQVEEALKGINYYMDWLWIEVGNYAEKNGLDITIKEPTGSNYSQGETEGAITITVVGLYQDIVDFIFDIENDNDLKFKLDNISMTYMNSNYMKATFKVLNVNVLFKE